MPTYSKCAQLIALTHFAALENKVSNIAFATNKMSDTVPDNNLITHRLWQHCQRFGDLLAISNKFHIITYTACGYFSPQTVNLYDSMCRNTAFITEILIQAQGKKTNLFPCFTTKGISDCVALTDTNFIAYS